MKTTTKRCEPVTQVSKVSGGLVRTLVLLTIAGLTLPGCKVEGGSSGGGRTVVGYRLKIEGGLPFPPGHLHRFEIRTSEIEAAVTIGDNTGGGPGGHFHFLTIFDTDFETFGNDGSLINGTTTRDSALPEVPLHDHDWSLEGN
jgi:hypothetical protein